MLPTNLSDNLFFESTRFSQTTKFDRMIFNSMKNIDTAFRHIRLFSILVIVSSAVVGVYAFYTGRQIAQDAQQRIYILANGKALEAFAADRKENIPVEARDHVKTFHYWFFSLDPDDKVITANITKALYLADQSAKEQYENLKENNYYSNLITGNISQEVMIDSISVSTSEYPYRFRCFGKQRIIRPSAIITRSLITEGQLRNVARSDNVPHGFLIEKWRILENNDLLTENR
jgi:conjugative transposon TraK protein